LVDVQAIIHGVEALDTTIHSSVALGGGEHAPQRLSEKGYQEMARDPGLEGLRQKNLDALDMILEAHGSVKNAQSIDGTDYRRYTAAARAYEVARQDYLKAASKREVEEFFITPQITDVKMTRLTSPTAPRKDVVMQSAVSSPIRFPARTMK
jgi:hypothetical protein